MHYIKVKNRSWICVSEVLGRCVDSFIFFVAETRWGHACTISIVELLEQNYCFVLWRRYLFFYTNFTLGTIFACNTYHLSVAF